MRDHVVTSMERALQRLEPYFRARNTHGQTYSRKQFTIELPAEISAETAASQAEA